MLDDEKKYFDGRIKSLEGRIDEFLLKPYRLTSAVVVLSLVVALLLGIAIGHNLPPS